MPQLEDIVGKQNIDQILAADKAINGLTDSYMKLVKEMQASAGVLNSNVDSYAKLKVVQDETTEQAKKLTAEEKKMAKEEQAIAAANKKATDQAKLYSDAIANEAKTIKELQLQNKALIDQRNKLNTSTKEGARAIKDINAQIDKNNKTIKDNSSHLEKQKINVGNYISSWGPFQGVATMFTRGIGLMKIAFYSLGTAIAATGIGALVILLGSLYTYFTRTGEGADKLARFMAQVRAVVDVLIDRFAKFGEGLVKIFTGDFKEGAQLISDSFKGIGKELKEEVQTAGRLADELDKLEEKSRADRVTIAKNNLEKEKALEIARSENSTLEEKEAAIKRAMSLARQNNQLITENADTELKALQEQAKMRTLNDDELNKMADLEIAALETKATAQSEINSLLKLQNKILGEVAKQEAVAADEKLTISKMEVEQFGLFEQTKTEIHAENMELRKTAEEELHNDILRWTEEERDKKIKAAQEFVNQSAAIGQTMLDFSQFLIDTQTQKMEQSKAYELQLAGDNAEKKAAIEKKYDKEASKLKAKQAKQDKAQALFTAIIKTAQAVLAGLAYGPPLGYVFAALNAVLGAIQIGVIAAQPIPQFFKGTESAPDGLISVAEKGQELIKTRSGKTLLARNRTLLSGMKGATIYSNQDTEALLKAGRGGYDSKELRDTLKENNRELIKTIKDKKEFHLTTPPGTRITSRQGAYFTNYWTRKLG